MTPMDFRLDPNLMSLLMLEEVADELCDHCSSGAAPAFSADRLVYRIEDEQEAQAFRERWLTK